jgi:sarcosine oxidase
MNDSRRFDVIVVGVGAMGSATCHQLAKRGVRVLGLEQFGIPHSLGSSHGESRMIRLCYYEHPDYVPLLHRAYQLWDELEQAAGSRLLFKTGGVYMGDQDSEFIRGTLRAAREHRLPHEELSHEQCRSRFPQFELPTDYSGVYEPNAGFLIPERVVASFAEQALRHGAELHSFEPVVDWSSDSNGVIVRTARATYQADRLVFCGGAWSERLLGEIGVKLTVTRQVLGWVWPKEPAMFQLNTLPVWAIDHPDGTQHYGFPMMPAGDFGRPGFKIAHHFHGDPTTADAINRVPQACDEEDFRWALRKFIPMADGQLLSMTVCMYTNSPDSHFIIDRHPNHDRVHLACGFSGHGFKFASVIGEAMADLAMSGRSALPIEFLGLQRFAK